MQKGSNMSKMHRRKGLMVAVLLASLTAAGGVGAYAATGGLSEAGPGAQLATVPPGPERLLRANGLNASDAIPVFSLENGDSVGLLTGASTKCLVRSFGGRVAGESCATAAGIVEGQAISVSDECGTSGKDLMEITGLAPQGTTQVRLESSDGTSHTVAVVSGAFKIDGTNPGAGDPYPTGVEWVQSNGSSGGSAPLPVKGSEFCLPTE
jgi:hypothetical protein